MKNTIVLTLCLFIAVLEGHTQATTTCLLEHCTDNTPLQQAIAGDSIMLKWCRLRDPDDSFPKFLNMYLEDITLLHRQSGVKFRRSAFNAIRYTTGWYRVPGFEDYMYVYELSYKQEADARMLEAAVAKKGTKQIHYSIAEAALFYLYRKKEYVYIFTFDDNRDEIDPLMQEFLNHCKAQIGMRVPD
jgi:hypothetical protein